MIDANLVAVSDPCDFKFDDELPEGDQHMNPEADDNSNAMRMLQSKQQVFPDSLDPRRPG